MSPLLLASLIGVFAATALMMGAAAYTILERQAPERKRLHQAVASGRVDCPGLSRIEVQERVAGAAFDALVSWVKGPAAARTL